MYLVFHISEDGSEIEFSGKFICFHNNEFNLKTKK